MHGRKNIKKCVHYFKVAVETMQNIVVQNTSLLGTTFIARREGGASLSGALFEWGNFQ